MADFTYFLNRQGVRGPKGEKGDQGFSPIITVATNTLSEYILRIQTQDNNFLTANLREHKEDLGGTYLRYNRETGVMYAGTADRASTASYGEVRFATSAEVTAKDESTVVSPANVADMIDATGISGDITELQGQVLTNTNNITTLQGQMTGLLANYVPKSRTINGKALSSNIVLTASDVGALPSTTPIPSKTSDLTNDSGFITSADLPDMNNYYTKTQTNTLLDGKADISDIPVIPTNVSAFTNDAGYITSADLPTVGDGTITFTQGGVSKGTITVNQSGDTTIALDAAGSSLTAGTGIDITNDVVSVDFTDVATASQGSKADTAVQPSDLATVATTGDYTDLLNKPNIPDVSNMVTTNTSQTISGTKTFSDIVTLTRDTGTVISFGDTTYLDDTTRYKIISSPMVSNTGASAGGRVLSVKTSGDGVSEFSTDLFVGDNTYAKLTLASNTTIDVARGNNTYVNIDSGNIGTYALTSLPVATTLVLGGVIPDGTTITVDADGTIHGASTYVLPTADTQTLGGVKIDGTTITIDNDGVISSSGSGTSYTAGTGIDITSDVISVDNSIVAMQSDLPSDFEGADGTNAGAAGLVPAPIATDNESVLYGDGTWTETVDAGPIVSGMGMPSNTYEDLTLGASGTSYTMPANGWLIFNAETNYYIQNTSSNFECGGNNGTLTNTIPLSVKKNDIVTVNYTGSNFALYAFRFFYAVGSESEAN